MDWNLVISQPEVSEQWSALINCLIPILDRFAPLKRIKIRNPSAPPVSDITRDLMAQSRRLLAVSGRTPEFVELNKRVRSAIRHDNPTGHRQESAGRRAPRLFFATCAKSLQGKNRTTG